MIFKSEIIEAINDTNQDLDSLAIKLEELEKRVKSLEKKTKETAKRGPGRPKKCDKA